MAIIASMSLSNEWGPVVDPAVLEEKEEEEPLERSMEAPQEEEGGS
jgi:hypothetical protein